MLTLICLVLLIFIGEGFCLDFVPPEKQERSLQVETRSGTVQGRLGYTANRGQSYYAYQGIPYARPPVGRLRLTAPKRMSKWSGVLDATKDSSECIGFNIKQWNLSVDGVEDCLYLNVYTPQEPSKIEEPLPVMFWIYGGGYFQGAANYSIYGPDYLIEENIIVVTFNYRVGIFGFLSTGDMESPGNYGLKDQLLALKWVNQNIQQFGGDPNKVTIAGQSAGAASVQYLLQLPSSEGLYRGAIMASASTLCPWAFQVNTQLVYQETAQLLGLDKKNSTRFMQQVRMADVDSLKGAMQKIVLIFLAADFGHSLPYSPTIEPEHDGAMVTQKSYHLMKSGKFVKVPVLAGSTTLEIRFYSSLLKISQQLMILYDWSPGLLLQSNFKTVPMPVKRMAGLEVLKHYFQSKSYTLGTPAELYNFYTDDMFIRPIRKNVELMSKHVPVYSYLFSFESPLALRVLNEYLSQDLNVKGTSHGEDIFYVWLRENVFPQSDRERKTVQRMVKLWANFVKSGDPTPEKDPLLGNVIWPKVDPNSSNVTYLDIDDELSLKNNYRDEHIKFWEKLYKDFSSEKYEVY